MTLKKLNELFKNIISWIKSPKINYSTNTSGDRFFTALNTNSKAVSFGYGSGQVNHGVWSETLGNWMIYSDGSDIYVRDNKHDSYVPIKQLDNTVQSITVTGTTATGSLKSVNCKRSGNVVYLQVTVNNSSSVAGGANIYQGTLSSSLPRPYAYTTGGSYYGNHAIAGSINSERVLYIRNALDTAVTISGSNTVTVSFTYVTQD